MKVGSQCYLLSAIGFALLSTPAAGQDNDRELADRLLECRAVESALERLDCYDQITRSLRAAQSEARADQASAARDGVAEGRSRADDARGQRDDFGREHRRTENSDSKRAIDIREAWQNPHGLWRFRLADGSEWHQTQSGHLDYREGEQYYIERGLLNSFRLSQEGSNRTIRVRRVD